MIGKRIILVIAGILAMLTVAGFLLGSLKAQQDLAGSPGVVSNTIK